MQTEAADQRAGPGTPSSPLHELQARIGAAGAAVGQQVTGLFKQASQAVQSGGDGVSHFFRGRNDAKQGLARLSVEGSERPRRSKKRKGVTPDKPEPTFNCTGVSETAVICCVCSDSAIHDHLDK